jgi:hypothetical protein
MTTIHSANPLKNEGIKLASRAGANCKKRIRHEKQAL